MENNDDSTTQVSQSEEGNQEDISQYEEQIKSVLAHQNEVRNVDKGVVLNMKIISDSVKFCDDLSKKYDYIGQTKSASDKPMTVEEEMKLLSETTAFVLLGKNIIEIANLDQFTQLEELYLKNNKITKIKGLDKLVNLTVLNLQMNDITKIENIKHLKKLQILDVSYNNLVAFDVGEIPSDNLIYIYLFDNPFFSSIDLLRYRSALIRNCSKIERIDKLDVSDRERLILIDEGKLKSKFAVKCLAYINDHYKTVESKDKEEAANTESKEEVEKVPFTKENYIKSRVIKKREMMEEKQNVLNAISTMQEKSNEFLSTSIFEMQAKSKTFSEKSLENKKRFLESEEVKKLREQIQILSDKFKKTNFVDPKVKEAFQKKINEAINFQNRITNAENIAKKVISKLKEEPIRKTPQNLYTIEEEKEKEDKKKQRNKMNQMTITKLIDEVSKSVEDPDDEIIDTSKPSNNPKKETSPKQNTPEEPNKPKNPKNVNDNPFLSDSDLD